MSDWEDEVDAVLDDKKQTKKFDDEEEVDSEEEEKKKQEAKKAEQEKAKANARVKNVKEDIGAKWEAKQKQKAQASAAAIKQTEGMSKEKAAQLNSENAEMALMQDLFSQELSTEPSGLSSKDNYVAFGKQVSDILYEGKAPYNVPHFFTELMKGLNDPGMKTEDVKKIMDNVTVIYTNKQKEEKAKQGGKKKTNKKPAVKMMATKAENTRNNNSQMIGELVGGDDDGYGNEYGEYGEEA